MENFEEALLRELAHVCSESRQVFAQHIGMSQARYQLLAHLAQQGETSHAALQQQLALDGATITRMVKQLEAEGVVSRRLDPQDNRYTLASLTDSGQQIVVGITEAHRLFQAKMLDGISREELEVTMRVLQRIRINISAIQEESQEQV